MDKYIDIWYIIGVRSRHRHCSGALLRGTPDRELEDGTVAIDVSRNGPDAKGGLMSARLHWIIIDLMAVAGFFCLVATIIENILKGKSS